jgi:thioredoxin 1
MSAIDASLKALTADQFQGEIIESETPVLIDFWAKWCLPCRMLKPQVAKAAVLLAGRVEVRTVDVDQEGALAEAFEVRGIPLLVLVKGSRIIGLWTGCRSAADIVRKVEGALAA